MFLFDQCIFPSTPILYLNSFLLLSTLSIVVVLYHPNVHFSSFVHLQVTKLDRDPASGTALQEISFWLNLERALLRIQDIRESPDIALTLDILKHGKRFHATVSFDTDTGDDLFVIYAACVCTASNNVYERVQEWSQQWCFYFNCCP